MNVADGSECLKHYVLDFGLTKLLTTLLPFLQLLKKVAVAVFEDNGDLSRLILLCALIAYFTWTDG